MQQAFGDYIPASSCKEEKWVIIEDFIFASRTGSAFHFLPDNLKPSKEDAFLTNAFGGRKSYGGKLAAAFIK